MLLGTKHHETKRQYKPNACQLGRHTAGGLFRRLEHSAGGNIPPRDGISRRKRGKNTMPSATPTTPAGTPTMRSAMPTTPSASARSAPRTRKAKNTKKSTAKTMPTTRTSRRRKRTTFPMPLRTAPKRWRSRKRSRKRKSAAAKGAFCGFLSRSSCLRSSRWWSSAKRRCEIRITLSVFRAAARYFSAARTRTACEPIRSFS